VTAATLDDTSISTDSDTCTLGDISVGGTVLAAGGGGGGGAGSAWDRLNQNNRTNQLGEEFWKALQEQLNTGFDLSGAADVQETARNRNMQQVQNQSGMNRNSPAAQMYSQMMAGQDSTNLALLKQQQMQQKLDLLRQAYSQFWGMSAA